MSQADPENQNYEYISMVDQNQKKQIQANSNNDINARTIQDQQLLMQQKYEIMQAENTLFLEILMKTIPWKVGWWECFGTILFAYGIMSSSQPYNTFCGGSMIVSMSLFGGILITAPFSGGHLNPAVSLAFYLKGAYGLTEFISRVVFQILGGFIGGFIGWAVLDDVGGPCIVNSSGQCATNASAIDILRSFIGETYATFIFVVIILVITDQKTTYVRNFRDSLIVFITIALCGLSYSRNITQISGGGLNPAIAIGTQFWRSINKDNFDQMKNVYIYIIGPMVGAFFSATYYKFVHVFSMDYKQNFKQQ